MEQPCYKCGASVEEGTPFCKQCGAPQIRVLVTATDIPAPQVLESTHVTPVQPLRLPVIASSRVEWPRALPAAALGGIISLLIARLIPYTAFGLAFIFGGAVAVLFYSRRSSRLPAPIAGAQIGAVSGGLITLFLSVGAAIALLYRPEQFRRQLLDTLGQMKMAGYDPQQVQQWETILKTHAGLVAVVVFCLLLTFIVCAVGSSIGGAFCAAWLAKRSR